MLRLRAAATRLGLYRCVMAGVARAVKPAGVCAIYESTADTGRRVVEETSR
jgi:hypothetical protein